ncbi:putative DNA-binding WGR domain protein [Rhizobium sp. PP-CC-3A-592]|nr:putative DNA-binding WGR domain protein [Rhizobium sp. PP-CC-3A-592]
MNQHLYYLYIERTQPAKNMARFYALSIEPSLFGKTSLVRRWGRIGTTGREKIHLFEDEAAAVTLFLQVARQKRQRGYGPRPAISSQMPAAYRPS